MRVVFVLIDGARHDVLRELLARGELPHLARHVIEPGGLTVGTSVYPSTTGVAYLPFLYGLFPGTAGIPGIRWLDRSEAAGDWRAQWRAARSYCGPQAPWINRDVRVGRSVFELVPESLAICTPLTNGLAPGAHLIPFRRALLGAIAHYAGTYAALDAAVADAWVAVARRSWRFLFVVFPGPDGMTHLYEPRHPKVLETYRAIDRALGRFMTAMGSERPALFVAADHGASAMPEHSDVALHLESWGVPTLRHPMHVWRRDARAAVMVSGNAGVQVYFDPRSGRATPLTEAQMPADILDRLLALPAVRAAAWRHDDGGVIAWAGGVRARLEEREQGGRIRYTPLNGDPLDLGGPCELDDRDMLARSRATSLPDAPRQLLQLFRTPRAGDVALAARVSTDFRGPWEIPEHKSGHGSLIPEHMEVPIAASVPLPDAPVRTVDLMPAMLEVLGVAIPEGLDGVPFSRLRDVSVANGGKSGVVGAAPIGR